MHQYTNVKNFDHLLLLLSQGEQDFFVSKNNDKLFKIILQHDEDPTTLTILNDKEGTSHTLTKIELFDTDKSDIGDSLEKGNLYVINS